jgi:hypothetical protein
MNQLLKTVPRSPGGAYSLMKDFNHCGITNGKSESVGMVENMNYEAYSSSSFPPTIDPSLTL